MSASSSSGNDIRRRGRRRYKDVQADLPKDSPDFDQSSTWFKDNSPVNKFMFAPQAPSYRAGSRYTDPYIQWIADEQHEGKMFPVLMVSAQKSADKIVVYFHGNAEDLGDIVGRARNISKWMEAHVCAIEYPGYGPLLGSPTETGIAEYARQAISYISRHHPVTHKNIIIYGRSIGAGVAMTIASRYGDKLGGLVLQSPFLSVKEYTSDMGGSIMSTLNTILGGAKQFESSKYMEGVTMRTMIIHGARDEVIPWQHGKQLYDICKSGVKWWCIDKNGDHERFSAERMELNLLELTCEVTCTKRKFELKFTPYSRLSDAQKRAVQASCKPASSFELRRPNVDKWLE
jgi:acetyl esterase/lipase